MTDHSLPWASQMCQIYGLLKLLTTDVSLGEEEEAILGQGHPCQYCSHTLLLLHTAGEENSSVPISSISVIFEPNYSFLKSRPKTVWPWTNCLISLNLSFLVYKMDTNSSFLVELLLCDII